MITFDCPGFGLVGECQPTKGELARLLQTSRDQENSCSSREEQIICAVSTVLPQLPPELLGFAGWLIRHPDAVDGYEWTEA